MKLSLANFSFDHHPAGPGRSRAMRNFMPVGIAAWLLALLFSVPAVWAGSFPFSREGQVMGVSGEITVWATDATAAARALDLGWGELRRVEQVFSMVRQGSAVNEINQFAASRPVEISPEVVGVLQWAGNIYRATQGAYDITSAAFAWEYGFGQGEFRVPAPERLEAVKAFVGYKKIMLYPRDKTVMFKRAGMQLDFGEIARSHALNSVKACLVKLGISAARIRVGRSITWLGANPAGAFWSEGVPHPRDARKWLTMLEVPGGKVLSSGDNERFFLQADVRYHAVLDPATGKPETNALAATLWLPEKGKLDLPSEALLLMPPAQAMALVRTIPGAEALIVDAQKNIWMTPGWKGKLKIQW